MPHSFAPLRESESSNGTPDAFALLQEEIAYLEGELRLRDEALRATTAAPDPTPAFDRKVRELMSDLAGRDETIGLLFDQIRQIEEAESSHIREWEQLQGYVEELERRVAPEGAVGGSWRAQLETELESQRQTAEAQRQANAVERRTWEAQRKAWEAELARLRAEIADAEPPEPSSERIEALEDENRLLRTKVQGLARDTAAVADLQTVVTKFETVKAQLDKSQDDVKRLVSTRDLDGRSLELELELEAERRKGEALRQTTETERRSWQAQRQAWEEEVQRLRGQLADITQKSDAQVNYALAALEEENQMLRRRCHELSRDSAATLELQAVRRDLDAVRGQLVEAQDEVGRLVEGREADGRNLQFQLDLERQKTDAFRHAIDSERRTWEAQRRTWEEEIQRLRVHLSDRAQEAGGESARAWRALEEENSAMRQALTDLSRRPAAAENESMRLELRSIQAQLDHAAKETQRLSEARDQDRRALHGQIETQRLAIETERRNWVATRTALEDELAELRSRVEASDRAPAAALAEENRQLKQKLSIKAGTWEHPVPAPARAARADLKSVRAKLDQSHEEIQKRMWKLGQLRALSSRRQAGTNDVAR